MHRTRWIPLVVTLAIAAASGCDVVSTVATGLETAGTPGAGTGDAELDAFLAERAEPDEETLEGVSGLAPIKITRSAGVTRQPSGDIKAGDSVTVTPAAMKFISYAWTAAGGRLQVKGEVATWAPSTTGTSVLKLVARAGTGAKAVLFIAAYTNGTVIKFREAVVESVLPAGWLQANDPFRTAASPSPVAAVSPSPSPLTVTSPSPMAARAAENLAEVPPCGAFTGGLSQADYYAQWRTLEAAQNWGEAVCVMRKGVQEYPNDFSLHLYRAYGAMKVGAYAEAVPAIEKALSIAPTNTWVIEHGAIVYNHYGNKLAWEKRRWEDASYWLHKAAETKPDWWWTWSHLGIAAANARDHLLAYKAWQKAHALSPTEAVGGGTGVNFKASCEWGIAWLRGQNKLADAIAYAELAALAFPAEAAFKSTLADLYVATNQIAKAETLLNSLPAGPDKEVLRGILQFARGDEAGALATFNAVSQANPGNYAVDQAIAKFYRGKVEALPYDQQMASAHQLKVVEFETKAVNKYFAANPYVQTQTYYPPLRGDFCLYQGAGGKSFHYGLRGHYSWDLGTCSSSASGTPVYAVGAGRVTSAVYSNVDRPTGAPVDFNAKANIVEIQHTSGHTSRYVHLKLNSGSLKVGDQVVAGQKVGEIGNTGVSTGPHLHFELADANVLLPIKFSGLKKAGVTTQMLGSDPATYTGSMP